MGRPYVEELSRLAETYNWALSAPVEALSNAVRSASSHPLVAVGSGGSYTTAQFAAAVHRQYTVWVRFGDDSAGSRVDAANAPAIVGPAVDRRGQKPGCAWSVPEAPSAGTPQAHWSFAREAGRLLLG